MTRMPMSAVLTLTALVALGCGADASKGQKNLACANGPVPGSTTASGGHAIKNVFVIVMENQNWSSISGSKDAPYINDTLLPMASHSEEYFNPPGNHPSLPNYLWMVGGTNFGVKDDGDPSSHPLSTDQQLGAQLNAAGISWKSYQEDIPGDVCPLAKVNNYAPKHNPFVYFADLTDNFDPNSATCLAHVRPLSELDGDLQSGTSPRFAFITPNLCDDMHNCGISSGDDFLAQWVPKILASSAYQDGGALFITWDEGSGSDGPIGMIVLSSEAKGSGYASCTLADHSSLLRTWEEIFGLPLLGGAQNASDLSDLFASFP